MTIHFLAIKLYHLPCVFQWNSHFKKFKISGLIATSVFNFVHVQIAAVIIPIVIGFWTSSSGAVVPKKKLLKTVIWVYWTNPLQYALNSLSTIAFFCDTNKPTCLDSGRNMACLNDPAACPQCDCKRLDDVGHVFLWTTLKFNRSFDERRVPLDMMVLALFCIFFRLAAGCVITYHKKKRLANK